MKEKNCEKKLIKLYSSINFSNPTDTKVFYKQECHNYRKLKTLIHFVGEYNSGNKPIIYFRAKVLLSSNIRTNGTSQKYNICVTDICFKNEFNVSASSITNEYQYLYDISCSSADNHKCSSSSCSSSSSSSYCSSSLSLSEIINNGIEKQITNNVREFIESDAFVINWVNSEGSYILDTTKYNNGETFPNVKMTIKFRPYDCKSSCKSSSTSSCYSSSSSSSSSHKSHKFIKTLIMACIGIFIIMILFKFISKHNIGKYLTLGYLIKHDKDKENNSDDENNKK